MVLSSFPHVFDAGAFVVLTMLAAEQAIWWVRTWQRLRPAPRVIVPATMQSIGILLAAATLAAISLYLALDPENARRFYWVPIMRRILGAVLLGPLLATYWWRRTFIELHAGGGD